MAFTPEQKKAYRAKKKREREQESAAMAKRILKQRPTDSKLKAPYKNKDLGKTTVDYGGHQKALNFPMFPPDIQQLDFVHDGDTEPETESEDELPRPTKIGTLTIGLAYEGDWKANSRIAGKGKRKMCKMSEQHLEFLTTVKQMLYPLVHSTLTLLMEETLRVNCLRGAQTLAHTDAQKGNAPNYMHIPKEKMSGIQATFAMMSFPNSSTLLLKLMEDCMSHTVSQKLARNADALVQTPRIPLNQSTMSFPTQSLTAWCLMGI